MRKITTLFLLLPLLLATLALQAQKADPVADAIKAFPYQKSQDVTPVLAAMQAWGKLEWKKFFRYLQDDSLKVKSAYALNAYVNAVADEPAKKAELAGMLSKEIAYAKSESTRILLQSQLNLLVDQSTVNQQLSALPKLPDPVVPAIVNPNGVQQLLDLQDQMEKVANPLEKRNILSQAARVPGFYSFVFVSKALADPDVSGQAALIVSRLALADENIRGPVVRKTLEAALPLIRGEDSTILVTKVNGLLRKMPYDYGFVSMFNGKDLSGWQGLVGNPISRSKMKPDVLAREQAAANEKAKNDWVVKDGTLMFTGHGDNLATIKKYGDFELLVDWKIGDKGDAGIYLRGSPQVQIWDTSRTDAGAEVGSGGLYNNQKNPGKPLVVADNKVGEWNHFHIIMKGEKVTVYLNGVLVTDNITMENYWDRNLPIFPKEQIELQAHGTMVAYRNLFVRELPSGTLNTLAETEKKQGFHLLFDGTNLDQWTGNKEGYVVREGVVEVNPEASGGGNLYTNEEFADFEYRFEFQLTPGSNNGIGVRAPLEGDAAYVGMEIQVLDSEHPRYANLERSQYHGSVYGVIPAKRGYLLGPGEWNKEEIIVKGSRVKVILNGTIILDGDIREASRNGTIDHKQHPGLKRTSGHLGFLGHGEVVRYRNMRVKKL